MQPSCLFTSQAWLDCGPLDESLNFSLDVDRILHSLAYTRYIDKTQVFYLIRNDHITHRVLHVQLVSKIARTIGRSLKLNEDLIEAIALGHDIGHTPFGHDGERFLSDCCRENGIGPVGVVTVETENAKILGQIIEFGNIDQQRPSARA